MVRRVTPSQLKNMIRKAERETHQAVNKYNREVDEYNRSARKHNSDLKRAVNNYNQEARAYNSRVRSHRRRLNEEIARLERQRSSTRYVVAQTSTWHLREAFSEIDAVAIANGWTGQSALLADLAEGETANSARVVNTLLGEIEDAVSPHEITPTALTDELSSILPDLDDRWRGALFALSPRNPDAGRHFCTSSREVLVQMLDLNAPDRDVLDAMPECARTNEGKPARKAKIMYLLDRSGAGEESLRSFIERDIDDVVELFRIVNSGTHGRAGRFDLNQLAALKKRVEGAIQFLSAVIRG